MKRRDASNDKAFLSVKDLTERWSVNRMTIHRLVAAGRLKPIKIGRQLRFPAEVVRAYEESGGGS